MSREDRRTPRGPGGFGRGSSDDDWWDAHRWESGEDDDAPEVDPLGEVLPNADLLGLTQEEFRLEDPFEVVARCEARMRERALLVDHSRLLMLTLARIALFREDFDGQMPVREWVAERIDASIDELLGIDIEDERRGVPVREPYQPRFAYLIEMLGIPPQKTRRACIFLNEQPDGPRRVFYEAIIVGRPLEELVAEGVGDPDTIAGHLESALRALASHDVGFDLASFESGGSEKYDPSAALHADPSLLGDEDILDLYHEDEKDDLDDDEDTGPALRGRPHG